MFSAEHVETQGDDGIGTSDGPAHSGLLQSRSSDGAAASLHRAGADLQTLGTEVGLTLLSGSKSAGTSGKQRDALPSRRAAAAKQAGPLPRPTRAGQGPLRLQVGSERSLEVQAVGSRFRVRPCSEYSERAFRVRSCRYRVSGPSLPWFRTSRRPPPPCRRGTSLLHASECRLLGGSCRACRRVRPLPHV